MSDLESSRTVGQGRLLILDHGPVREIRLNRPDVHNALDEEMIRALTAVFTEIRDEIARDEAAPDAAARIQGAPATPAVPSPRGILLSAEGKSFCAGADLSYMRRVAVYSEEENRQDARKLSNLFRAVRECPVYVLARIQGAALGGGAGLAACCDRVIASRTARFGFTEVRLGVVPAVISPFVIERIGPARARALFPTGETFDAEEALRIGLIDRVVPPEQLEDTTDAILQELPLAAPHAARAAKELVRDVHACLSQPPTPDGDVFELTARTIARMRSQPEGQEGMAAFLEKRKPSWVTTGGNPE